MKTSESTKDIDKAILDIQSEMDSVSKDKENPFFHSKYADLNSVWSVLQPLLSKNGLIVLQPLSIRDGKNTLITCVKHVKSGEYYEGEIVMPDRDDPQKTGSIITYFRRYLIVSMFGIMQEDDDGNKGRAKKKKKSVPESDVPAKDESGEITKDQIHLIGKELTRINSKADKAENRGLVREILGDNSIEALNDLSHDRATVVLSVLEKMIAVARKANEAQVKKIYSMLNPATGDKAKAQVAEILGRESIVSMKDLTSEEANKVIKGIEDMKGGLSS